MKISDVSNHNVLSDIVSPQPNYLNASSITAGNSASLQVSGSPSASVQISIGTNAGYVAVQNLPQGLAVANNPGNAAISGSGAPSVGAYLSPNDNPTLQILQHTKPVGYTPSGAPIR